jgi:uncharacterized phiE125 gp8 family phage protein
MVDEEALAAAAGAARGWLRAETEEGLRALAATAFAVGEAFTGAPFLRREVEEMVDAGGRWARLRLEPVRAITAVIGIVDGAEVSLAVGAYAVDIDAGGRGWVRCSAAPGRLLVRYEAGLAGSWDQLPAPVAQGVVSLVAHLHADRGAGAQVPVAVGALWRPWRRVRMGMER